jgi:hypothetical protein
VECELGSESPLDLPWYVSNGMTAEERALGQTRLRNKLLAVQQDLAIRTEDASELSDLLSRLALTLLHRPADLRLTAEESNQLSGIQKLADEIRTLETRERELKEKVSRFG